MPEGSSETEFDYLSTVKVLLGIGGEELDAVLPVYISMVKQSILNYCNIWELPEELNYTLCQMTADTYRDVTAGQSNGEIKGNVLSVSEDGRSVSFGNGAEFKTAQYDGDNDVVVNSVPAWISDNQLAITATGQSITFIEFGSGVYYSEQHPRATDFGYERGAYGQGKGSQNAWGYYGVPGTNGEIIKSNEKGDLVITHGNPPARAMYDAGKEMRSVMVDIARKVWSKHD